MKTRIKFIISIIALIIICAWTTSQISNIEKAEWLIGTWENKTEQGSIYETWRKTNDHELSGKSYMVKEQDTVVFESIRLVQEQNSLVYIPTVKNQNNELPVRFTIKTISEKEMVFENYKHDFPQIISYSRIGSDSLVAEISGMKNGHEQKLTFPMKKVK